MHMSKKILNFVLIACFGIFVFGYSANCAAFELTPEGAKLYKQWTEIIGYSAAVDLKRSCYNIDYSLGNI